MMNWDAGVNGVVMVCEILSTVDRGEEVAVGQGETNK